MIYQVSPTYATNPHAEFESEWDGGRAATDEHWRQLVVIPNKAPTTLFDTATGHPSVLAQQNRREEKKKIFSYQRFLSFFLSYGWKS